MFVILNTKINVMIVGASGREASLASKVLSSPLVNELYVIGTNPRIAGTCVDIDLNDIREILNFAKEHEVGLTIVGSENQLALGIVDLFEMHGLKIFGPSMAAVRVETDKAFAKDLMDEFNIPTASYVVVDNYADAIIYEKSITYPIVLKFSGLAFGKGVVIAEDHATYVKTCQEFLQDRIYGAGDVVIEEFLDGEEFSYISIACDTKFSPFSTARDYKRIYDGDLGPNTGGMGMISPHPLIDEKDLIEADDITQKILDALKAKDCSFKGFIYAGLIKTANGIKVIEFNARMGDPEGEILFNKMSNDLVEQLLLCLNGDDFKVVCDPMTYVGVVVSAKGYPKDYVKKIDLSKIEEQKMYYMNAIVEDDKIISNGGRVLFYYEAGTTLETTRSSIYQRLAQLNNDDLFYRKDIGSQFENMCNHGIKE